MRSVLLRLHRYIGLTIAAFLIVAGLTGAVVSWGPQLDRWINSDLYSASSRGELRSPGELAAIIEAREPRGRVTAMPLQLEPGQGARFTVGPRTDPRTGESSALDAAQVFVDPVTGAELGRRPADGATLSRRNLIPYLVQFHYNLQIPEMWGITSLGVWFTGTVALAWFITALIGIFLTFPLRRAAKARSQVSAKPARSWWQRWKPSWRVRWRGGSTVLNFDLHRAGALWVWPLLLVIAFTGFSQNLLYAVLPAPFEAGARPAAGAAEPDYGYAEIVARAREEAARLGWTEPAGTASHDAEENIYNVYFFHPGEDLGEADVGVKTIHLDGNDGSVLGHVTRWGGSAAEAYMKSQYAIHSLRILGPPGRILSSVLGLMVAMLSVTGVIIWLRKRRFARPKRPARKEQPVESVNGYAR